MTSKGSLQRECIIDPHTWEARKKRFLQRMREDIDIGYLDHRILGLLKKLNKKPGIYTTSSCSGRIVVLDSLFPWHRDEDNVAFKSHEPVEPADLEAFLELKPARRFWVQVTGPILHAMTIDTTRALHLLDVGRRAGFKHSGIMGCSEKGYLVELVSGVQVTIPFKDADHTYVDKRNLPSLTSLLNTALMQGWSRIIRMEEILEGNDHAPEKDGEDAGRHPPGRGHQARHGGAEEASRGPG